MRSELAEELLNKLMGWDSAAFQESVRRLEALATYKYDEYGNFRPGVKFFESLATWLAQFPDQADREVALNFLLQRLLFISDAQMTHLIELVYPDHIEAMLRVRVASHAYETSRFAVAQIARSPAFRSLRRRTLILGASDGARLDRLRRSAPTLSHEQFLQSTEPPSELIAPMCEKLEAALHKMQITAPATFAHIFLVDDFAGSGRTLIRDDGTGLKGKIPKLRDALRTLQADGLVAPDIEVTLVLYVAAELAQKHVNSMITSAGLTDWTLRVVQELPSTMRVDVEAQDFADLAERYYDEVLTDEHKGRAPLGYSDCALPLVLSHNTPNNSVSLLWADTTQEEGGLDRKAIFPRYERHHKDRP